VYAVSGWSGSEAIFWAGSNLQRNFAYTDGAAYNPTADSWRELPVPGWGHPGLTGVVFNGRLYVAAKGGTARVDPAGGSDPALPDVDGFIPAAMVATDEEVWTLGPIAWSSEPPVSVAIARYDPGADAWIPGPVFEGSTDMGPLFQDLLFLDQPIEWTGSEIVVWSRDGHGLSFDPVTEQWRSLQPLDAPDGSMSDSVVTVADSHLVALVEVERNNTVAHGLATWDGASWRWRDTEIEATNLETVTIAGAEDWLMLLSPDQPPYTIHVPTGDAMRHDDAPVAEVQAPNVVWTGNELVIWGGVPPASDEDPNPPTGAAWVPPRM
jgi:hypothetical protein